MIDEVSKASYHSLAVRLAEHACQAGEEVVITVIKCSRECSVRIFDNGRMVYAKVKYEAICSILPEVLAKLAPFLQESLDGARGSWWFCEERNIVVVSSKLATLDKEQFLCCSRTDCHVGCGKFSATADRVTDDLRVT